MADGAIVLDRPWWAHLLGTDALGTGGLLGPVLVVGGGTALLGGAGTDAAVVVVCGVVLCEVLRRDRRVGVVVDDEGLDVRNRLVRRRVRWSEVEALRLAGVARLRPAAVTIDRRRDRVVEVAALNGIGRRRRVAWLAEVAPVALAHGVDVVDSTRFARYWHGVRHLPVAHNGAGRWRVRGVIPPPPQTRMLVVAFAVVSVVAAVCGLFAESRDGEAGDWPLWSLTTGGAAVLLAWERAITRRMSVRDGNATRPPPKRT